MKIHSNIGGDFECPACKKSYKNIELLMKHLKIYHLDNIPCNESTIRRHLGLELKCPLETCFISIEAEEFLTHLKNHLDEGNLIECPIIGSQMKYKVKSSFAAHMHRKHTLHTWWWRRCLHYTLGGGWL
jgi:hypothetical protein